MYKTLKIFLVPIMLLAYIAQSFAIKATPETFYVNQPDGSLLKVRLSGDEFFHYMTTDDGILLARSADNYYKYARMTEKGLITPTGMNAKNPAARNLSDRNFVLSLQTIREIRDIASKRAASKVAAFNSEVIKRAYPLGGTPKTLIILVNFADKNFTVSNPQTAFTNLLNEAGYSTNGGTGSAKDYFRDASNGAFSPQFDVVGPYTLPQNMAYYGENVSGNDKNPRQMVIDACNLADQNGVNFTQYDTDNDGVVDNVFIYYAGYNEAEGGPVNTIWPHRWTLANGSTAFDGKIIFDYACTSELRGSAGSNMCGIGTFCHEFGHVLGLVDYYDTADDAHYTVSYWNIMDAGAYLNNGRTPPTYSAYDRFFLGWLTPVELKTPENVTINPILSSNQAYLISQNGNHNLNGANPNPAEFIMLENRQKTGWDTFLPGHGLLVTRINYNPGTWYSNTANNNPASMGYDIVEADGLGSNSTLAADPFPGTANVTSYQPVISTGLLKKPLSHISETGGIVKFLFMGGKDAIVINTTSDFSQFTTVQGTPSAVQTVSVNADNLNSDLHVSFTVGSHYEIKKASDSGSSWSKNLTFIPVDSIVPETVLQVRYNPSEPSYKSQHLDTLIFTSANAESIRIPLVGTSTRPVYVVPPIATAASAVTYVNFVANWQPVNDASGYYFTAYSKSNGKSRISEGFDRGLIAPNDWVINATKINSSTVYSGVSSPSIVFQNSNEYIQTEKYFLQPDSVSFFARSIAEQNGWLKMDGFNGTKWQRIDSVRVNSTLNKTVSFRIDNSKIYNRFKLIFTRSSGQVSVDDLTAIYNSKIDFLYKDKWVEETEIVVPNVIPDRDYYYLVRASDRTLYPDSALKYENITDYSNVISLKSASDPQPKILRVMMQTDGSVNVIVADTNYPIYIYNSIGQLLRTVVADNNVVNIQNLPRNQVYILKSGEKRTKIIL